MSCSCMLLQLQWLMGKIHPACRCRSQACHAAGLLGEGSLNAGLRRRAGRHPASERSINNRSFVIHKQKQMKEAPCAAVLKLMTIVDCSTIV